jgi:hypothetical protein
MALTAAQLAVFKAAILADANLAANRAAQAHGAIADYYAQNAASGTIWRPIITVQELNTAIVWSEFSALTALLQNAYMALISPGYIDATSANVRGGFTTIFAAGTTSRTNLTNLAQRTPTRFEALFTTAQVCSLFGYVPSVADVAQALGS